MATAPCGEQEKEKRRTYSGVFKAGIVLQYIKGDKSLSELAAEYRVHPNQIKNWKSILLKRAPEILADKRKTDGN